MVQQAGQCVHESLNLDPEPPGKSKPRKLTKSQRTAEFILRHAEAFREIKPRPPIEEGKPQ